MPRDSEARDGPNWWVIGVFTTSGVGLLVVAYYASSYWQGVLDNGGTALLLFALLVFAEPKLVHHLRQPSTLNEALARFTELVAPRPQGITSDSAHIKDRVLRSVGRTGLHQEPPKPSSAQFTNLGGALEVEWRVEWDEKGLRHLVTAGGRKIPRSLDRCVGWDKKITAHEERIYRILCYLLDRLEEPHAQG